MRQPPPLGKRTARLGLLALLLLGLSPANHTTRAQPSDDLGAHVQAIKQLSEQALAASRASEQAATVAEVKRHADAVFETVWGLPSGLAEGRTGAAAIHGWKTRWQVTYADFDEAFAGRYGAEPPEITDPAQLGLVGRGLYVRKRLLTTMENDAASDAQKRHAGHVVAALNNVIGWMQMDDGVTKAERQPRVDLTRQWDAPSAFWLSTADTGWLYEVYAQALNILKTDYEGDVATARQHAAALTRLLEKTLSGVDADEDGSVAPAMMEGGLNTALQHAQLGGFLSP
jgi:hypothetical protein